MVKFLTLEKKCEPLCRENYGNVPAFYAVEFKHLNVLEFFLLKLNIDPLVTGDLKQTLFHKAAFRGNSKIWRLLRSITTRRNIKYNTKDENGITPLHIACREGHIAIVKQILNDNPCKVLPLDDNKQTPLHYAARKNRLEVIKFLIQEKGFDPLPRDIDGDTPLHFAARRDDLDIVQFYESLGCSMLVQNKYGSTPQSLLRYIPVDPEEFPTLGQNPLHLAAESGNIILMKWMLRGISPNSTDQLGRTTLHFAAMNSQYKALKLLLHARGNPLVEDVFNNLPLHYAAAQGHLNIVMLLIEKGSPYNTKGVLGLTPLRMAAAGEHHEVHSFLWKKLYLKQSL